MTADVRGIFIDKAGSSPFLNFTTGVLSETFSGLASALEYPGIKRYSLKVLDGSLRTVAIFHLFHSITITLAA
jgi:hypothetical protein